MNDINIDLSEEYEPPDSITSTTDELSQTEIFDQFISELLEVSNGKPMAHVVSHVVMELFQPGFVIVASPNTSKLSDGTVIPTSVGVAMSGNSDMTKGDVIRILRELCDSLEASENPESLFEND
jgi:hypothetical protein